MQPVSLTQPVSPTQATTYSPNALNQYTSISRTNPLRRVLQGIAHPGATIEVKLDSPTGETRTVARVEPNGAGFIAEAEADTAIAAVWRQVVVEATRPGVGVNGASVKTKRTGWLFFPPQNETLVYDKDGNLKEDARWLYIWDGENRLTAMEEKQIANSSLGQTPPPRQRLEYTYDSQSRRVRKVVKVLQGQTWSVTSDLRFVYDAWNMIAEFSLQNSALILHRSYTWGYDLSGSEQGAGGVGGLVLVNLLSTNVNNGQPPSTSVAPCYDGNGNILAYLDCVSGDVTQRMEYDAFGNEMTLDSVLTGNTASVREVPFRFSTKYADSETGLSYYGYRYYSAELGRWTGRDPSGERGGVNLYVLLDNNGVNKNDFLGLYVAGSFSSVIEASQFGANLAAVMTENQWNNPGQMRPWIAQTEWGGSVCKCNESGKIGITELRTDNNQSKVVPTPCPKGWETVGVFHSHPYLPFGEVQSPQDKDNADPNGLISSMAQALNPNGQTYTGNPNVPRGGEMVTFVRPDGWRDPKNATEAWSSLERLECCSDKK